MLKEDAVETDHSNSKTIAKGVKVTSFKAIKDRPLNSQYRDEDYPSNQMPFYLYGNQTEKHIDHMLLKAPNIQLSAAKVGLSLDTEIAAGDLQDGCIVFAEGVHEAAMQPFPPTKDLVGDGNPANNHFVFREGQSFDITVFKDKFAVRRGGPGLANIDYRDRIANGKMTLAKDVWVDSETVNRDPFKKPSPIDDWRKEFDLIGKELE